jgi:hypothetical protein
MGRAAGQGGRSGPGYAGGPAPDAGPGRSLGRSHSARRRPPARPHMSHRDSRRPQNRRVAAALLLGAHRPAATAAAAARPRRHSQGCPPLCRRSHGRGHAAARRPLQWGRRPPRACSAAARYKKYAGAVRLTSVMPAPFGGAWSNCTILGVQTRRLRQRATGEPGEGGERSDPIYIECWLGEPSKNLGITRTLALGKKKRRRRARDVARGGLQPCRLPGQALCACKHKHP